MPLTTMFVEVLTSVTELVTIEENASGMRSLDALMPDFFAMPKTIGRKNAVEAVLLMNAPMPAEASMTIQSSRSGSVPAWRKHRPPGELDHAGALERRGEDEQTEDHDDRIAAKARERLDLAGSSPVKASASNRPSAIDFRRDALPPKQRERHREKAEEEKDLWRHGFIAWPQITSKCSVSRYRSRKAAGLLQKCVNQRTLRAQAY